MSSVFPIISSYLFNALWQAPFLALTGWLICRFMKRVGPSIEHRVWVLILYSSILLPAICVLQLPILPRFGSTTRGFASMRLLILQPATVHQGASLTLPAAVIATITVLYLVVSIYFLLRLMASVLSTIALIRSSRPLHLEPDLLHAWVEAQRLVDIADTRILSSSSITGPVTLWFGQPVLLLPRCFASSTSLQDFRVAIAHECAHIARQDFLKNLFYEGLSLFIAFHPVTWLIKAQITQTREMTCDAMAVRALGEARVYVQSLLRLASAVAACSPVTSFQAIGIFDANILEKRIMTLRAKKEILSPASRYGLLFAGSLCLFLAVTGGAAAAVELLPERPSHTSGAVQEHQIYKVGKDVSAPVLTKAIDPEYPPSARKKEPFKGTCLIGLVVDASGMPREVHVVRSLSKAFDDSATKAVEQYRFKPAQRNGQPVPVALSVEVAFQSY